ncbi:MarR family winged helix-turn-helix transcriptional regulator [Actinomarinicola tropica]|uniref:MarR family transcriptional regulator n=1 Tax=Actinomarinicola tropica TaxID=2789776 RepID=A0A5Q2RQ95_9ACTN|nr:MarR family transcriptional regulator [Actinomarinicola tropica]QGG95375.1 MarR family transcriptional regulator [Actinomarinicola tropica]
MPVERISREAAHAAAVLAKSVERALHDADLSPSQYRLLVYLSDAPSAATALAKKLSVTRPSLTALVDTLEQRGYVVRGNDPTDRRRVTHEISAEGRAAVARADATIQQRLGTWLDAHLTPDEVAAVNTGLELWLTALRNASARRVEA